MTQDIPNRAHHCTGDHLVVQVEERERVGTLNFVLNCMLCVLSAMSVAEILVGNLEPGEEEREHRLQIYQLELCFVRGWGLYLCFV